MTIRSHMRLAAGVVALAAAFTGLASQPAHALESGQAMPAFSLVKMGGGALSPADLKGSVVYLDFWASWCAPCKQSFPWLNEMQAKYKDKGLKVVAINLDQKTADAEAFLKDTPAAFTIAFDAKGDSPSKFQVKGMPSSFLIGPDGTLIKVHSGFKPADRAELEAAIQVALAKVNGGAK